MLNFRQSDQGSGKIKFFFHLRQVAKIKPETVIYALVTTWLDYYNAIYVEAAPLIS